MANKSVHINLPNQPESVSLVRLTVSGIANQIGFSAEDINEIKMAVSEACNQLIKQGKQKEIDIIFNKFKKKLVVNINNCYIEKKQEDNEEERISKVFLDSFMDKVEYGNDLKLTKNLK